MTLDALPATVRYVKNGEGGRWWAAAKERHEVHLGWRSVPHDLLRGGDIPAIKDLIQSQYGDKRGATQDFNMLLALLDYALVPGRVRGYDRRKDGKLRNIEYDDHAAYAAGGLRATAGDFLRWSRAALDARLFPARLRDEMLTPRHGNYGLGWQIRRFHGRRVYNHTGGIDGFATHIAHYPDDDVTILVFTNVESDPAILFACDAAAILFDVPAARRRPAEQFARLESRERCGVAG